LKSPTPWERARPHSPAEIGGAQQFLLWAILFAALMAMHAPLLRLPYFWDEAGYYVPAARDLYLSGSLIPHSTISNAHPPLVLAWLAAVWRIAGYSPLVTRTAMLALAAFSLLGFFRLARQAANSHVAVAATILVALYPPFFTQCSLAQVDLPAAGFTFWGLLAYLKREQWQQAIWFTLAAFAKETAILAPLALLGWELAALAVRPRRLRFLPPERAGLWQLLSLAVPVGPLAAWFAYHYARTGYLFGNPEFFRYNVASTLDPLRIPLALAMRLWQTFGYFGSYLLAAAALLALLRRPQTTGGEPRPRIAVSVQAAFGAILIAYLVFMSVVGGALLTRYLLPVIPLVMLLWVSTIWRRLRYWRALVAVVGVAFVAGWYDNPPYGFSLEDNLAYRDAIVLHAECARFVTMTYPGARVLTAWPASDEISRPWLGYVARPLPVVRIEDFTAGQVERATRARGQFDVALVFSTKYEPPHAMLENWEAWGRVKEKYFGYHHDLRPEEITQRLGGRIVFEKRALGQWAAVIEMNK
jgi:Dolichyl-phosphate-mannose-protein mannosyltransferase